MTFCVIKRAKSSRLNVKSHPGLRYLVHLSADRSSIDTVGVWVELFVENLVVCLPERVDRGSNLCNRRSLEDALFTTLDQRSRAALPETIDHAHSRTRPGSRILSTS